MTHAENLVRNAWLQMLHGECDYTGAEMHATSTRCDTARRTLAAALLGRDPDAITLAYADLEGRIVTARIATRAYEQARETLNRELRVAYHHADDQLFDEYLRYEWPPGKSARSASGQGPGQWSRAWHTLGWLSHLAVSWLLRLAAGRRL